ncbi:GNAT family N-acetyltransferase [Konateibacter massiliensis]|uniref:GNAT family N-acetyltransferase n=1 Tax=Konateibacter massiliensis TaxID=2002841 RepID=UPI000C14A497|nr:GNAT family N-acetyltransferase [Konateibacter massiliensis]
MERYQTKINTKNIELAWAFKVSEDMCDNPQHYEDYLKYNALLDLNNGHGVTYLFIEADDSNNEKIIGYITLRMSSLIKDVDGCKKHGYPALEISELAVHKEYVNNKIGTIMVMSAINTANELNEVSSVKYIVLCADPKAEGFYKKLKFDCINNCFEEIPREHFNENCVPMYMKLR